ncbi:MAG: hypothetical protein JW743_11620 [Deltaproteobacteria bacterium]|nr:hypothetical protein [Deltaproteobacteria bacterium]MBN2844596.1 hypothetical protein [Deltaproteobacteria bacterium]
MGAGLILMAAGIFVVRFLREKHWWLKFHRPAGITGVVCLGIGLVAAVVMVSQGGNGHLQVPHAWLGLAGALLSVSTPVLGHLQFKIRSQIQQLRRWHRRTGYISMFFSILAALSGLVVAGYI